MTWKEALGGALYGGTMVSSSKCKNPPQSLRRILYKVVFFVTCYMASLSLSIS